MDDEVFDQVSKEYLKRLNVIWFSNISIPRKIKGTNTFVLPVIQYHMWTAEWRLNDLRQLDRETREVIQEYGGMHSSGSTKLFVRAGHVKRLGNTRTNFRNTTNLM